MIEAELAITELKRRAKEAQRKLQLEERTTKPDLLRLRTLQNEQSNLLLKAQRVKQLADEVKSLESTLSMKMMNRYPENKPYRNEFKRELTRLRRTLKDTAVPYQPKPAPRRGYSSTFSARAA